jgi:hypothetical protein
VDIGPASAAAGELEEAAEFELELIESRTLDDNIHELIYRLTLRV